MLLEKLKQHSGKIMFFVMNMLVVATGVLFMRQKDIEKADTTVVDANAQSYNAPSIVTLDTQQQISIDNNAKTNSFTISNPSAVEKYQEAPIAKTTVPVTTKTTAVEQPTISYPTPVAVSPKTRTKSS